MTDQDYAMIFNKAVEISKSYDFWPYWVPIIICVIGYSFETVAEYNKDAAKRLEEATQPVDPDKPAYMKIQYTPQLKVGHIVGRFLVSFIPVINLGLAIFKFLPNLAYDVVDACSKWLDIPLVPKKSA